MQRKCLSLLPRLCGTGWDGGRGTAARQAAVVSREVTCQGYKGSSWEQDAIGHLEGPDSPGPCAHLGHLEFPPGEPTDGLWQLET